MTALLDVAFAMSMTSAPAVARRPQGISATYTSTSETPAPEALRPLRLSSVGTRGPSASRAIASAAATVTTWNRLASALPVDEEAEAFVSRLIQSSRTSASRKTRLAPRSQRS